MTAQAQPVGGDGPYGRIARFRRTALDILAGADDRRLAQRTALYAFAIRAASAALAYLSQVILARWIGDYDYGLFVFVWVAMVLVGGIVPLGFTTTVQRFVPHYSETGQWDLARGFTRGVALLVVGTALVFSVFALGAVWLFQDALYPSYLLPICLGLIALPLFALTEFQDGIARNHNWVGISLALPYIARPLAIIGLLWLMVEFGMEADAVTAVAALVIAVWAIAVVQLLLIRSRLSSKVPAGPRAYDWKLWFKASLPVLFVEGFYLMLINADVLILSIFKSPDEVGIYYATVKTLALVAFVYFAVVAACAHKFATYHAAGDHEKLHAFVRDSVTWTFWPSLAVTVVLLAAGPFLLGLFGEAFLAGYPLMFILAVGLLARAAVGPVERLLNMLDQQNACARAYAGAFAVNITLNFVLIPIYGLKGAAIATTTALIVESILLFNTARTRLGINVLIWSPGGGNRATVKQQASSDG